MTLFLAFALPLTLYLCFPSTFWNFDGVACAAALELGNPSYLFHANHLLYGFLGSMFWHTAGETVGLSRALPALQLFTSLLSAGGLVGVYLLLLHVVAPAKAGAQSNGLDSGFRRNDKFVSLLLTFSLAFTAAFWIWSIEAQVYTLGFLALAWATYVLLFNASSWKYSLTGVLHGLAILGHITHALWLLPALFWIRQQHPSDAKAYRHYLGTLALVTVIPYLGVLLFVIAPGRDMAQILIWLKGSAGLTPDRHWAWHSAGWDGPWIWLRSTLPAMWGSFAPYGRTPVYVWLWATTAFSMALGAGFLLRSVKVRKDPLARFAWLWIIVYGLFLSTWEPATLCYRLTDVLPLGILMATGLREVKITPRIAMVTVWLISLFTVNLNTVIGPMSHAENNQGYQETLSLSRISPETSLYITQGGQTWMYLLYFTGRTAWNGRSMSAPSLMESIRQQKQERPIFVQSSLLRDPNVSEAMKPFRWQQLNEGSEWLKLI